MKSISDLAPVDLKKDMLTYVAAKDVKKVALCCPARGTVQSDFINNWTTIFTFFMRQPGVIPLPILSDGMPLDKARNDLVKCGLLSKADFYLFIDSDVYVHDLDLETLWKWLLAHPEAAAVTGIYYEREIPYHPVIRRFDKAGRMQPFTEYPTVPFEVDGAGMGLFLVRAEAVNAAMVATNGKPFQFTKDCSEDLFFCRQIKDAKDSDGKPLNYKIFAHPEVQASHYGSFVSEWHYRHYLGESYVEVNELTEYLNRACEKKDGKYVDAKWTRKDVLARTQEACYDIHRKFEARFPGAFQDTPLTPADTAAVDAFYEEVEDYIFDLTKFWIDCRSKVADIFARIPKDAQLFLDYGCGIGDYGLTILENFPAAYVTFYDINKPNLHYLEWRLDKRKDFVDGRYRILRDAGETEKIQVTIPGDANLPATKVVPAEYDVVFCLEVLEHLANPAEHAARIRKCMSRNGILIASVGDISPAQAAHISGINLEANGFKQLSQYIFMRDDSDLMKKLEGMRV